MRAPTVQFEIVFAVQPLEQLVAVYEPERTAFMQVLVSLTEAQEPDGVDVL